jgi:hypothetical protein
MDHGSLIVAEGVSVELKSARVRTRSSKPIITVVSGTTFVHHDPAEFPDIPQNVWGEWWGFEFGGGS